MQYKINVSIVSATDPCQVLVEVCLVYDGTTGGNTEERYRRVVSYSDDDVLLETVRQALNGQVLGGQWDLVGGGE